ncbi:hypothetical protein [Glycomyces paridis]|uniref:Uncharacterized protein n=1 Tax=Glycomyces paridis TaxID=2126555 RepID=A0A4S8PI21_9ACTN|nr:hypothetical protein [Glycomyces paridis]THV30240.1 hypothetical protein E9998_07695 [Glycomyces paridis]
MPGPAATIDEGSGANDHTASTTHFLDQFQDALTERWQDTIVTSVRDDMPLPSPYSAKGERYTPPDLHRNAGMAAHFAVGQCDQLAWYDGGRDGSVPSSCHGRTAPEGVTEFNTFYYREQTVENPLTVDCCLGELLALAEDWSWETRELIRGKLPPFADHNTTNLQVAYEAFARISTEMGLKPDSEEFKVDSDTFPHYVESIANGNSGANQAWMVDWTGLAADTVGEGYMESTAPTFKNQANLIAGLANMINMRYEIIRHYRESTLTILALATSQLGATVTVTETTDLGKVWMAVTGTGMSGGVLGDALALAPGLKEAAGVIKLSASGLRLLGWTGTNFTDPFTSSIEQFEFSPEEVVVDLLDEIRTMLGKLQASEEEYAGYVSDLRARLNQVPTEYLELYDFGRNQ